jgi:hypothetical protein
MLSRKPFLGATQMNTDPHFLILPVDLKLRAIVTNLVTNNINPGTSNIVAIFSHANDEN